MSAKDGIFILCTHDRYRKESSADWVYHYDVLQEEGICVPAYRVAYAINLESVLSGYERHELYNVGYYLNEVWGDSEVYYNYDGAIDRAQRMEEVINDTELGICFIARPQYSFPI